MSRKTPVVKEKANETAPSSGVADKPQVDFKPETQEEKVIEYEGSSLPAYPNLVEAINKVMTIVDVEYRDTRRGRIYYIHSEDQGSYYTWSKVVGRQLEEIMEKYLSKGYKVRVKVKKVKNYLTLASPKE